VVVRNSTDIQFTARGVIEAEAAVRQHRLLEMYMMEQTDADVGQADREADYLEHGLMPEHVAELQGKLTDQALPVVPPSPHPLNHPTPDKEKS
jgi:Mn-dependent DtxR family transcriptional regulator